jgi:hypothetical protein
MAMKTGNNVTGGQCGVLGIFRDGSDSIACLVASGNTFSLYPADWTDSWEDSAAVSLSTADRIDVAGNTLLQGDHGLYTSDGGGCTNAVILQNDFALAGMSSIWDRSAGGVVVSSQVIKNNLGSGASFHLGAPCVDGAQWFLLQNTCLNSQSNTMSLFLEPLALPVHYQPQP